jgi:hypothetical protein
VLYTYLTFTLLKNLNRLVHLSILTKFRSFNIGKAIHHIFREEIQNTVQTAKKDQMALVYVLVACTANRPNVINRTKIGFVIHTMYQKSVISK